MPPADAPEPAPSESAADSPTASAPDRPTLPDPWDVRGGIRLNGAIERTSFGAQTMGLLTGFCALGVAFILFQVVVAPIVLFSQIGLDALETLGSPDQLLATYSRELIVSNSAGQIFGLALPALLFAWIHTSRPSGFLRLRGADGTLLALSAAGVVVLQPVVWWLAEVNRLLPVPEGLRALDESQMEMIRQLLGSDMSTGFTVVSLAVVPALCEELLFRGYTQRQFERALGAGGGIVLAGILFGLYHLRPTQLLPLAVLGIYLGYLTWRTGSLLPAIVVHFVNNALAVVIARYAEASPDYDMAALETMSAPWYVTLAAFVFFAGVAYVLHRRAAALRPNPSPQPSG